MAEPQFEGGGAPSLSDAINKLMANPEIISSVASALGGMTSPTAPATTTAAADTSPEPDAQDTASEPAALPAKAQPAAPDLGELMNTLAPMMSMLRGAKPQSGSPHHSKGTRECDRREALLCALKPYVSDGRREAIDHIIRISQISDILKNIGEQP